MGGVLVGAILLYVLVSIFNDGIEDEIRWKVLAIAGVTVVVEFFLLRLGTYRFLALAAVLISTALVALLLIVWCKLSRSVAAKVAGSFLGIRVALAAVALLLFRPA
jgi:hypothetical protein